MLKNPGPAFRCEVATSSVKLAARSSGLSCFRRAQNRSENAGQQLSSIGLLESRSFCICTPRLRILGGTRLNRHIIDG